jgi:hypothetical protein
VAAGGDVGRGGHCAGGRGRVPAPTADDGLPDPACQRQPLRSGYSPPPPAGNGILYICVPPTPNRRQPRTLCPPCLALATAPINLCSDHPPPLATGIHVNVSTIQGFTRSPRSLRFSLFPPSRSPSRHPTSHRSSQCLWWRTARAN